jgi:hypothetical protein
MTTATTMMMVLTRTRTLFCVPIPPGHAARHHTSPAPRANPNPKSHFLYSSVSDQTMGTTMGTMMGTTMMMMV